MIRSPKSEGVSGLDIGPMFREGRFKEIAQYCAGDVIATAELFRKWDGFINIKASRGADDRPERLRSS
ncbi:MAG: hypothetical protein E6K56_01600 [Ignavibacteria bacterium]|nr:MAG: hypothetical protein E6K56_01600 [Ignavibacteria bacterium]